ncbi:hypothetical protein DQ04_00441140 [Trypanosoma grayi]|uniref:hypothetical protein n=1 Tax=Trypanosoma grayi TaxID=71804 RepID=UPI0004F3F479|nr:hypothetical protein DQ04_00441140 [Trypanosoma grayi]KEG14489.1 hypothetical protein DQ04_00441140 [Trypanosoma grayi]
MDEGECLEFPSFEAFDSEDRPPPPPIEDYPIGCEVDLVDLGPAKIAQTNELWEPFMDTLFGQGRRSVRVVRHQGDYTFVVYDADPEMAVGCTLYRACLSEPKVRFKKYIPHHQREGTVSGTVSDACKPDASGLFEVYGSSSEEDNRVVERPLPVDPTISSSDPLGTNPKSLQRLFNATDAARWGRSTEADIRQESLTQENANAARRKYNYAMKKAYEALTRQNCVEAVRYYTKALKYSPDGGARALSNRSVAFLGLHNAEAAFKDATRVIELTPQSCIGYVRAGNTLRGVKKYEEARTYYENALALDPENETLKYLLLSNSVMMLYAPKLDHRKVASIMLDRNTKNVVLHAKKNMRVGELAWKETTTTVTLLFYPYSGGRGSNGKGASRYICCQCYHPLTRVEDFCDSLPGIKPSLVRKIYSDPNIVQCNGQCGEVYCSESCRAKAWAGHHWVECSKRGKWSESFRLMPGLLAEFAADRKCLTNKKRLCAYGSRSAVQTTTYMPSLADDSVDVIIACVRLACRMFATIVSSGRPLEDAVQMYEWMLPKESSYNICLNNHATNLTQKIVIDKILTPVYSTLRQCFTTEEQQYLSFNVFFHCYERARFNAVKVRTSAWPGIQRKAEGYVGIFKMRSSESTITSLDSSTTHEPFTKVSPCDSKLMQLERIVATPAEAVAGYFECLAVFKVFVATFAPKFQQTEEPPCYNVKMRSAIEPSAIVHIDVTENILKGEQLVADRSHNALIV